MTRAITVYIQKYQYTPAVSSTILSKLIFASCVRYSDRAYHGFCALIKDIGRRLPLQLQSCYHGQQCDVIQSVPGNYKTRCAEDNIWQLGKKFVSISKSIYQVHLVSRITGDNRAEFLRTWGPGFDEKGVWGDGDGRGSSICAWTL